jgi:hypothetical protein
MASRKAFSSSATDPVPAEPLLLAVAWPNASPEASTTKHIFSNNLIELFLLCCSSVYRPVKVINSGPWLSPAQEPNFVLKLACQFHTIISRMYILMYKEMQHVWRIGNGYQFWKKFNRASESS